LGAPRSSIPEDAERTEVYYGAQNVIDAELRFFFKSKRRIDTCMIYTRPSLAIGIELIKKSFVDAKSRGVKLRYLTEITKDNIDYCEELMKIVDQFRHLEGIGFNFMLSEIEYLAPVVSNDNVGKIASEIIYSNIRTFVDQQQYFFDMLWNKAIPAEQKIREIEEGVKHPIIEVIEDTQKSIARAFDIINLAKNEISAMFASANTFLLAVEINALDYYQKALQRGVKVCVLIPSNATGNDHSYNNSLNSSKNRTNNDIVTKIKEIRKKLPQLDIRIADKSLQTRITILVVDNSECMIWELKDETKQDPYEAGGIATYSNINSIASSYALIFHALWKQTEILEQLKVNDKIQKDFISIAAHELRTPIQPILSLSDILLSKKGDIEQHKVMLEVIKRNARRLKGLTEDILDVAKIESGSFLLKKERINLNKIIPGIIAEYVSQIKKINNVDMVFISKNDIFVKADKARLSQVFGNILNNAIKFTTEGKITIKVSKMKKDRNEGDEVVVSVKDTGTGIEPVISSILFTKFATKSDQGTGLGLYISKNIIEAHCGRIWAENNADGRGATFYFSLPMDRS
jgi:two-component system, OmpR family, sensor histidine kinase VicK